MRKGALALLLLSSSTIAFAQQRVSVVLELESPPAIESYLNAGTLPKPGATCAGQPLPGADGWGNPLGAANAARRGVNPLARAASATDTEVSK